MKKSLIVAFAELLQAADADDEVLLLRSSDVSANDAVQTYNTAANDDGMPQTGYTAYMDQLAEKFDKINKEGETYQTVGEMPDMDTLKTLGKMLKAGVERVFGAAEPPA